MKEIEVKLNVSDIGAMRALLRRSGWRVAKRRYHEKNAVYDRRDHSWLLAGRLMRVREAGGQGLLTVKLPVARQGIHKIREEHEVEVNDTRPLKRILEALDFEPAWQYEKYRTELRKAGQRGKILLDETPVGDFLELEGPPRWIDQTAIDLGFSTENYIVDTYRGLFVGYLEGKRSRTRDMLFGEKGLRTHPARR